jgi:hypothetical protein
VICVGIFNRYHIVDIIFDVLKALIVFVKAFFGIADLSGMHGGFSLELDKPGGHIVDNILQCLA